jgi:CBS domain-containing protein
MAEHGVTHLVVLDAAGGNPIGVLSTLDIAAVYAAEASRMPPGPNPADTSAGKAGCWGSHAIGGTLERTASLADQHATRRDQQGRSADAAEDRRAAKRARDAAARARSQAAGWLRLAGEDA